MANLDASWAISNGLTTQGNPTWLNLYLAACKLLDVALILPSEVIPQFQLYRWAFTGDPGAVEQATVGKNKRAKEQPQLPVFVPHVFRISKLMTQMVILIGWRKISGDISLILSNIACTLKVLKELCFVFSVWTHGCNPRSWTASSPEHYSPAIIA